MTNPSATAREEGAPAEVLCIFDIDGTLLLNGRVAADAFRAAFLETTGAEALGDGIQFAGMTDRGIFRALLVRAGLDEVEGDRLFAGFERRFTERLGEVYPTAEGPHLLPGVRGLVRALAARRDVALALGTGNCRPTAYIKLARFGLDGYFPLGGFGDRHEDRVEVIRAAISAAVEQGRWRPDGGRVWVIGDTVRDVVAGHAAGAKVLVVGTGPGDPEEKRAAGAEAFLPDLSRCDLVFTALGLQP